MPSAKGLVDTGALLALLDRNDRWHAACRTAFDNLRFPLLTSAAVVAELFHLLEARHAAAAWELLRSGAVSLAPIADADLASLEGLMMKYRDRPMDFADATLVHLAERESLSSIFTVDHDDFETYRIGGSKRFRIVPARRR